MLGKQQDPLDLNSIAERKLKTPTSVAGWDLKLDWVVLCLVIANQTKLQVSIGCRIVTLFINDTRMEIFKSVRDNCPTKKMISQRVLLPVIKQLGTQHANMHILCKYS